MKHFFMAIAIVMGMMALSSANNDHDFGSNVGNTAPLSALSQTDAKSIIDHSAGKYLLITFWQSDDATSRLNCKAYDTWMRKSADDSRIAFVGINLDANDALFNQIVRADNLNTKAQVTLTQNALKTATEAFGVQDARGSLLVAPDGKVVAVNPAPETLQSLII